MPITDEGGTFRVALNDSDPFEFTTGEMKYMQEPNRELHERFLFRNIDPENPEEYAVYMEHTCMPPTDACTREEIMDRASAAPELFLIAVDRETGQIAGILNGVATNESVFTDDFFSDAGTFHDPNGTTWTSC